MNKNSYDYQYEEFVAHPKVRPISERAVWISVDLPGQGDGEEELPAHYRLKRKGSDLPSVIITKGTNLTVPKKRTLFS
ncbi:hypothetical protein ACTXT7_007390 [Hymenolepis weldensis]